MVFYFTATGNSLYVAKRIDEYPVSIPQVIKNSSICSDSQVGVSFAKFIAANIASSVFTLALKRQLSLSTRKTKTSDTEMKMYHSMK